MSLHSHYSFMCSDATSSHHILQVSYMLYLKKAAIAKSRSTSSAVDLPEELTKWFMFIIDLGQNVCSVALRITLSPLAILHIAMK